MVGTTRWPSGCTLKYVNGYNFSSSSSSLSSSVHSSPSSSSSAYDILSSNSQPVPIEIELPELEPQETVDVSISLRSPDQCGMYQCQYRTFTRIGQPFGDPIWLLLNVEVGGVLGITQQLNSFSVFGREGAVASNPNSRHFSTIDPSELNKGQFEHQQIDSNNNTSRFRTTAADEKRPDFYDDMFR